MDMIKDYDISKIPFSSIVFAVTSDPEYEMDRAIFVENYPEYSDYMIINGCHCSCYGFEDTTWDAYIFTPNDEHAGWKGRDKEILKLMQTWIEDSWQKSDKMLAGMVINYMGKGG